MTYQQILDRDVPQIVRFSKSMVNSGAVMPIIIYYRHEAICGTLYAEDIIADDGWKPAGVSIPCDVPWDAWNNYLRSRLTNVPLFA